MLKDKCGKTTDIIGHDGESKKQIKVLNRFISVKDSGYTYEPAVEAFRDARQGARAARWKGIEHTCVRHVPRERRADGSRKVQEVSVHVRSSELLDSV